MRYTYRMDIRYVSAKTIVTHAKPGNQWFGMDYNMNIYRGCSHGCIYCDSRSECYGVQDFDRVSAKQDALAIIERELKGKMHTGVIATGAMSDPYNPIEAELELTRNALRLVDRYGFGVAIATKSPLIVRDADILASIATHSPVMIKTTVTTADDALCKQIEPHVPPSSERLRALEALAAKGLFAGLLLMPVLPFINDTDENINAIVHGAAQHGAQFIYGSFSVTLRTNQRVYFLQQVEQLFPGMKQKYLHAFGSSYYCKSPRHTRLRRLLSEQCRKHGLYTRMPDIIRAYKRPYQTEQLTLF